VGAALARHIGEVDRSGGDEEEKMVKVSRSCGTKEKGDGGGKLGLQTQARLLYTRRPSRRRHGPGHRLAAESSQAQMSWFGPYWAGSGRHGSSLDLFFFIFQYLL
jgi:hypothetical protein